MKKGKKWLVIVLAVAILGTIAVGVAVADNASPAGQSPQNLYQAFLGNLAKDLNIDQPTLTTALTTASTQTVNQEVASGKITQTQANQILSQISSGKLPIGFLGMGFRKQGSVAGAVYGKMGRNRGAMGGFMIMKPLASALGMNPKDVMSALRSGQTISDLASSKNLTVTQIESTVLASVKSQLDKSVQSGKLTQDQENQTYNKLEQNINSGDWITQLQKVCQNAPNQKPGGQQATQ